MSMHLSKTDVLAYVATAGAILWWIRVPLLRWMLSVLAGYCAVVFMPIWLVETLQALHGVSSLLEMYPYLFQASAVFSFAFLALGWIGSQAWNGIKWSYGLESAEGGRQSLSRERTETDGRSAQ